MLSISASKAVNPSSKFLEVASKKGENNIEWINHEVTSEGVWILLFGGVDPISFRVRVAQSHLRHDLTPSSWSDSVLIFVSKATVASMSPQSEIIDISLNPENGFGFPAPNNAVQNSKLGAYRNRRNYPNIAAIRTPVDQKVVVEALEKKFKKQRAITDGPLLLIHWLGFAWGVGNSSNPLLEGYGHPSSAMIDTVIGAAGYDLTPGLESRNSSPESIWQSAKWWHVFQEAQDNTRVLTGSWNVSHRLLPEKV